MADASLIRDKGCQHRRQHSNQPFRPGNLCRGPIGNNSKGGAERRSDQRTSATNLIHYLALRGHDLRKLQKRLAEIGVSSLGRSEGHILDDVDRVLEILRRLHHSAPVVPADQKSGQKCTAILEARTEALLGPAPVGRNVRIMVTAPSEAATNYELVHQLLQSGMNCLRINCAYDSPEAWSLDDILRRMETHQAKKRSMMRSLRMASNYRANPHAAGPSIVSSSAVGNKKPWPLPKMRTVSSAQSASKSASSKPSAHRKGGSKAA